MIDDVTRALVSHIKAESPDLGDWVVMHSLSAAEPGPDAGKLVICLLAVEERAADLPGGPLAGRRRATQLRLGYLVTYLGPHEEAMARISTLLAIFRATPVLGPGALPDGLLGRVERLVITLRDTTAEERHHVWTALGRPGRLCLFYDVEVVPAPEQV